MVECTINKIKYINPNSQALSWDDRQKLVIYDIPSTSGDKSYAKSSKTSSDEDAEEIIDDDR